METDEDVWRYLQVRKQPGDSFNDVLRRELGLDDSAAAEHRERAATPPESGAVSRAREALAAWQPENVDTQKARRATVAVVGWLAQQDGRTPKREIIAWAADEDYFGYSESTFWRKAVSSGLSQLADAGVVDHQRNKGWRVVEDGGGGR